MEFSPLAVPDVVKLTMSGAASDGNFVKMTIFPRGLFRFSVISVKLIAMDMPVWWSRGMHYCGLYIWISSDFIMESSHSWARKCMYTPFTCKKVRLLQHSLSYIFLYVTRTLVPRVHITVLYGDRCVRRRYQGQGQVITSHSFCGM